MGWYDSSKVRGGSEGGHLGGHQEGILGEHQGVLQGVLHGVESFQMDSGRGNMGQEWSGVVSAEV